MHASEQKPCSAGSSAAKRALTCSSQPNDAHRSLLRNPRAARIVRWLERSVSICIGPMAMHKHGRSAHEMMLFAEAALAVARPFPLLPYDLQSHLDLVSCHLYCHSPREPRRSTVLLFGAACTQRSFCAVDSRCSRPP